MRLYYSRPSPFARKALVALIETNQINDVELEEVKIGPLAPGEIVPAANPLGKIPTLLLPDGASIIDSKFICRYIDEMNPNNIRMRLYPEGDDIWQALRLEALADGLLEAAVLLVYEIRVRAEELRVQEWVDAQLIKITRTLAYFENNIIQLEKNINMGSLTVAIALDYLDFRHKNIIWRKNNPKLFTWHETIKARKSLSSTMPID
jgi:glutathione S-transferase